MGNQKIAHGIITRDPEFESLKLEPSQHKFHSVEF